MAKIELSAAERRQLRAEAHHLDPVVSIGANGLTDAVREEVDTALRAHGLLKVRIHGDAKAERQQMLDALADALGAAQVQHIGKLGVLWRPKPEPEAPAAEDDPSRGAGPRTVKVVRYSKRGGQRPQARQLRVLGNERVTPGGKIKRARRTQKSVKKGRGK